MVAAGLTLAAPILSSAADAAIMKGVDVTSFGYDAYGDSTSDAVLKTLSTDHANWVALTTLLPVNRTTDSFIPYKSGDAYNTGPNAHMAHAIAYARKLGMHVSLKIQPVDSVTGQVLQNYNYVPKNRATFFRGYKSALLQYATFAQQQNVELIVMGTELGGLITGPANLSYFTDMISSVRRVFKGGLSYAATAAQLPSYHYTNNGANCDWCLETDEIHWVSFWSQLDYVGVDAYPMLTTASEPSTSDLVAAMFDAPDLIEHTSERFNQVGHWASEIARTGKPAILTETGAPSATGAALCTGCGAGATAAADPALQERLLSAMLQVYTANVAPLHLAGVFLFNANAYVMSNAADTVLGYEFIGKPAEGVVSSTYSTLQ